MATQAVKFYSVASLPATPSAGALYFVSNGELYKGTKRFGANKVYTANAETVANSTLEAYTNGLTDLIAGDILLGYQGAKVWDGAAWQDLSADTSSIIAQISDSTSTSTANGITVSVTTSDGYVTGVEVGATEITNVSLVSATTGSFTDLVVANTATFSATSVEASSLTVNGSTIEQIAGAQIAASVHTGSISSPTGTSLVNEGQVVNYVSAQLESFGNAMHFTGVATPASFPTTPASGDIIVIGAIGSEAALGFNDQGALTSESASIVTPVTQGQEYIYDGTKWEKIGDESVPSGGSSVSAMNGVSVEVVTAQATAAPTVTLSGFGDAAAKSVATTLDSSASNLPTESAVAAYVSTAISAAELVWLDENNAPINT